MYSAVQSTKNQCCTVYQIANTCFVSGLGLKQIKSTMAEQEIEKFVWKFRQFLAAGSRAGLTLNCENGRAWVNMSVNLGPWRPPPSSSPWPSPNPTKKTHTSQASYSLMGQTTRMWSGLAKWRW